MIQLSTIHEDYQNVDIKYGYMILHGEYVILSKRLYYIHIPNQRNNYIRRPMKIFYLKAIIKNGNTYNNGF